MELAKSRCENDQLRFERNGEHSLYSIPNHPIPTPTPNHHLNGRLRTRSQSSRKQDHSMYEAYEEADGLGAGNQTGVGSVVGVVAGGEGLGVGVEAEARVRTSAEMEFEIGAEKEVGFIRSRLVKEGESAGKGR